MKFALIILLLSSSFAKDTLNIGVHQFEPMVIKEGDNYSGFDIDLWNEISNIIGVKTNFVHYEKFTELFDNIETGKIDAALSGISINYDREIKYDFTHPYKKSGLQIITRKEHDTSMLSSIGNLFTGSFVNVWLFLLGFVFISANLIWFAERGSNAIDDKYTIGIWQSLWWTIITVTTVGYGDIVPKKVFSRVVAILVMLVGIGVAGLAIGELSSFSIETKQSIISDKKDLVNKKVAVMTGTTSEKTANSIGASPINVNNFDSAISMLESKKVSAVIFDAPVLQYRAKQNPNLTVAGKMFDLQDYGILLPRDSDLKEQLNRALLLLMQNGKHQELEEKWFGI